MKRKWLGALALMIGCGTPDGGAIKAPCESKESLNDWRVVASADVKYTPTEICPGRIVGYQVTVPNGSAWHLEREMPTFVGDVIKIGVRVEPGQSGERFIDVSGNRASSKGDSVRFETVTKKPWNVYKIGGTGSFWIGDATFYFGP